MIATEEEMRIAICPKCSQEILAVNFNFCLVCEDLPEMCGDCEVKHSETHTAEETLAAHKRLGI